MITASGNNVSSYASLTDGFVISVGTSLVGAFVMSTPSALWQTMAFISPGLHVGERDSVLSHLGGVFATALLLNVITDECIVPVIWGFLHSYNGMGGSCSHELKYIAGLVDYFSFHIYFFINVNCSMVFIYMCIIIAMSCDWFVAFFPRNKYKVCVVISVILSLAVPMGLYPLLLFLIVLFMEMFTMVLVSSNMNAQNGS